MVLLALLAAASAADLVGQPAPDFTLPDLDGKEITLSSLRGRTVVLEWFNPGCPFVQYAHEQGPLSDAAAKRADQGVVWLAINSGAPGKQGHGLDVNRQAVADWNLAHPILRDENGEVGRAWGARATPQVFVVDPQGVVRYAGAVDNAPLGKVEGQRVNYLDDALDAVLAGKPVRVDHTPPYGCSVKY